MDQAGSAAVEGVASPATRSSPRYAGYALALLMLTFTMNFVDRKILAILIEPIKADLHLSDTYLGFLTGFSFAVFYGTLGVPLAMLADRSNRRNIIAWGLVIFSAFTFVCGLAGAFWQLVLARVGVGAGEAATNPASQSIIADTVPPEQRGRGMSIYALGANVGTMIAFLAGAWLAQEHGWRSAFMVLAIPGLALALLIRLTLREPARGAAEGLKHTGERTGFAEAFIHLWSLPSYRHILIGVSLAVFAWNGVSTWAPSFLARSFGMTTLQIGGWLALIIGLGGGIGTLASGVLADRLGQRDVRWNMWMIAIIQVVCFPFCVAFYLASNSLFGLAMFLVPAACGVAYTAATLAMVQTVAPLRMRALAASFYALFANLIGQGLGPQIVGILSDLYRPNLGQESLRYALLSVTLVWLWSAVHFVLAARTLKADVETARFQNVEIRQP